jgi:hypothetical protein
MSDKIMESVTPPITAMASGFNIREPPPMANASRSIFDFWRFAQNLFDLAYHKIRFIQRAARRHNVIEHEAAFIHLQPSCCFDRALD